MPTTIIGVTPLQNPTTDWKFMSITIVVEHTVPLQDNIKSAIKTGALEEIEWLLGTKISNINVRFVRVATKQAAVVARIDASDIDTHNNPVQVSSVISYSISTLLNYAKGHPLCGEVIVVHLNNGGSVSTNQRVKKCEPAFCH